MDEPLPILAEASGQIGIDLGLTCFAAFPDGSKHQAPRPLRRKMAQLKRAQKALSRKQRGSKNRNKARIRVARIHQKISDIRRDDLHQLSTRLVRENQTIAVEDLNVRGMMALHSQAGAIGDSGWSELVRQLEYKSNWYGRTFVRIDRWFPSSQLCSACGWRYRELTREEREWTCQACGVHHDRDVNAARNILAEGLRILAVGLADSNACGGSMRPAPVKTGVGNRLRSKNRSVCCAAGSIVFRIPRL